MSQRFILDFAVLPGLAGLIKTEKSVLSPLNITGAPPLTPEQVSQLRQAGLVDAFGQLTAESQPVFDALAATRAYTRIHVTGFGQYLDYAVYFGGLNLGDASMSALQQGLQVEFTADPAETMEKVERLTGGSAHKTLDWEVSLPPLEALVLAAIMDQRRRAVLRALADDKPALPGPADPVALAQVINATADIPQWLVSVVKNISGVPLPVAPAILEPACKALVEKGLAWQDKTQVFPTQPQMMMADRLLVVGNVLSMDAANVNEQGAVAAQRCTCLQAGLTDVLHIELFEGQVHLQTISAAQLLDMLRYYLSHSDAVPAIPLAPKDFYLTITAGAGAGQNFPVTGELLLGRGADVDVHLLDIKASRHHAVVKKVERGIELSDLSSTNGTYLNGEFVSAPMMLKEDDDIAIGETHLKVMAGVVPAPVKPENQATVFVSELKKPLPPEPVEMPEPEPEPEPAVPVELMPVIPPMAPIPPLEPIPAAEPVEALPVIEPEVVAEVPPPPPFIPEMPPAEPQEIFEPPAAPPPPFVAPVEVKRCPTCANEVDQEAKFCGVCGTRL